MLFNKLDFTDPSIVSKLQVDPNKIQNTWEFYYHSYAYAVEKLFEKGLRKKEYFNRFSRSGMFLIRHSLELLLKNNLAQLQVVVPTSHNFEELLKSFPNPTIVPDRLQEILKHPMFGGDGSAFRYCRNKYDGSLYFQFKETLEIGPIIEALNSISPSNGFIYKKPTHAFDYNNRKIAWDLTFHMGETNRLGPIRGTYDAVSEFLLDGIINDGFDCNLLALPLLFLIRHSLELALKINVVEAQGLSTLIKNKDVMQEHSLMTLYNIYNNFLSRIDTSRLQEPGLGQYKAYKPQYDGLHGIMHHLDINSRFFRFPYDPQKPPQHKISKNSIVEILETYYFVDPFVTFTNDVLMDEGLL